MGVIGEQVGGDHYQGMDIQPTEYWKANHLNGDEAAIVSYVSRWRLKGGVQDLQKARHHIQFLLEDEAYTRRLKAIAKLTKAGAAYRDIIRPGAYAHANGLQQHERNIVRAITVWNHTGGRPCLLEAAQWLDDLIAEQAEADHHQV